MKAKKVLYTLLPILVTVVIVLNADTIIKKIGIPGMIILMTAAILINIVPFISAFKGHPFLKDGKEANRINEQGIPATAVVLSIGENSKGGTVTINKQPVLNLKFKITISNEPSYEVSFDSIVPRTMVPLLQPGGTFSIKVDPKNRARFVLDKSQEASMQAGQFSFNAGGTPINVSQVGLNDISGFFNNLSGIEVHVGNLTNEDSTLIKQKGNSVLAKLNKFEDLGRSENYKPVISIVWEIHGVDKEPYDIYYEKSIDGSVIQVLKNSKGKTFPAKVHPDNKEKLIISLV